MFSVKVPYLFVFSEWFCTERRFSWTEDNRLEAVMDNYTGSFYNYDAAGERNYKLTGSTVEVYQNGGIIYTPVFDKQTLYASPLITINEQGYTKHYFEEGSRICSSIGDGGFKYMYHFYEEPDEMDEKHWKEIRKHLETSVSYVYQHNFEVEPYTYQIKDLYDVVMHYYTYQDGYEPVFYYHTDHLGSASYITDNAADVIQQIAYLPYGEDWVDIRSNGFFGSAYKFNGKEKDLETGYNYYGARYYTDRLSIWLSVDPLTDNYPSLSGYNYCANNPVRYIDPDGRDWYEYTDKDGNSQTMWRKSQDKTYKDGSGNIWNNIGQNYLSINGDNATLFTQHTNSKGELYLSSSSYNLADEKNASALNATLGNLLSKGSAVAGSLGGYAEGSNATFRLTNSKGALDFKFYGNGWKGNQWVTPNSVSNLGKVVQKAGKIAGLAGIGISLNQFFKASTLEGKLEYGLDVFMGGMGFVPVVGTGVSLYWSFGGKTLHNMYVNKVLIPQIQMGINPGLPVYQPFK